MPYKLDPKKEIAAAFLYLLNEKPVKKITILDICKRVGIVPATFYRHYKDKYDVIEYLTRQLFSVNKGYAHSPISHKQRIDWMSRSLEDIWNQRKAVRNLFSYGNQNSIYSILFRMSLENLSALTGRDIPDDLTELCIGYAYGRCGLMKRWLENEVDFREERYAELMLDLCPAPLAEAYGWI